MRSSQVSRGTMVSGVLATLVGTFSPSHWRLSPSR